MSNAKRRKERERWQRRKREAAIKGENINATAVRRKIDIDLDWRHGTGMVNFHSKKGVVSPP